MKESPRAWSEAAMPTSRVPPSLEGLLSRGGTRPLFGSRARAGLATGLPLSEERFDGSTSENCATGPGADDISYVPEPKGIILACIDGPSSKRQIPDMQHSFGDARDITSTNGMRICATKVSGGDCGDTSGFRTLLHGPHKPDSDLMGQGTAIGGDISKLRRSRKTLRRGRACSVFTASAWPAQVLSGAGRWDHEGLSASTRDDVEASHSGLSP